MTAKIDPVVYGRKSVDESDITHVDSAVTSQFGHTPSTLKQYLSPRNSYFFSKPEI